MNLIHCARAILPIFFFSTGCMAAPAFNDNYIGVGYGATFFNTKISSVSDDIDFDRQDGSLKFVAGRNISPEFAVELIYVDFGEGNLTGPAGGQFTFDATQVDLTDNGGLRFSTTGYGLNGVFVTTLSSAISMDLKLGILFWDRSLTINNLTPTSIFGKGNNGSDVYFGIGFNYGMGPLTLSLGAESYQFDDVVLENTSRINLDAKYGFSF